MKKRIRMFAAFCILPVFLLLLLTPITPNLYVDANKVRQSTYQAANCRAAVMEYFQNAYVVTGYPDYYGGEVIDDYGNLTFYISGDFWEGRRKILNILANAGIYDAKTAPKKGVFFQKVTYSYATLIQCVNEASVAIFDIIKADEAYADYHHIFSSSAPHVQSNRALVWLKEYHPEPVRIIRENVSHPDALRFSYPRTVAR